MALYRDYVLAKLSGHEHAEGSEQILAEALSSCRSTLPAIAAKAIELRYDQGLSFDQVATAIGRSAEATRQIVTRARIALKLCIQKRLADS
jgi:DNA-directed RNA polymerase specialized sigma24 family protein